MKNAKKRKLGLKRTSIRELSPRELRVEGGLVFYIPGLPQTRDPGDPMSIDCNASCGLYCGGEV